VDFYVNAQLNVFFSLICHLYFSVSSLLSMFSINQNISCDNIF